MNQTGLFNTSSNTSLWGNTPNNNNNAALNNNFKFNPSTTPCFNAPSFNNTFGSPVGNMSGALSFGNTAQNLNQSSLFGSPAAKTFGKKML